MMAVLTVMWGRKMVDPSDSLGSRLVDLKVFSTDFRWVALMDS